MEEVWKVYESSPKKNSCRDDESQRQKISEAAAAHRGIVGGRNSPALTALRHTAG